MTVNADNLQVKFVFLFSVVACPRASSDGAIRGGLVNVSDITMCGAC